MDYCKGYVAEVWMTGSCSTLKDLQTKGKENIPQNAKHPLWLSTFCVLSICKPTCITWQNHKRRNHKKNARITPLSPYDWWHLPSSTGKVYPRLVIVIIYCCRFFSEAIQAKTSLPPFTVASSTSKHWTVNRENYLSILIMHCRFYIQFIVSVCVNECVTFENAAGNVLSVGRKVVMLNSYGSVGVNRKD